MIKVREENESDEVHISIWDMVGKPEKDMALIDHLQTYCVMVDAYYTPAQLEEGSYMHGLLLSEYNNGYVILINEEIIWTPND